MRQAIEVEGVHIGMPVDDLLKVTGKPENIETLGRDQNGYVVEWTCNGVIYTLSRVKGWYVLLGDVEMYAVQKIEREVGDGTTHNQQ